MSNAADIAAHTRRSADVCLRIHATVTDPLPKLMPMKDGIVEVRQMARRLASSAN